MKNILTGIAGVALATIVVLLSLINSNISNTQPQSSFHAGSTTDGGVYTASSSNSTAAGLGLKYKGSTVAASSSPISGVLGSFVITGTSATIIEIKDATSTTDIASTTLASFAASAAVGTYTFDAAFNRGLIVNYLGSYAGTGTITYK